MATNPPAALLDPELSGPASHPDRSNSSSTPSPPQRPPRGGHANLVRPSDEPAATAQNGAAVAVGGAVVGVRKSTCPQCTNISIMQLFYEMKNRFPTVSDEQVNECVLDHCHQRQKLLAVLQRHSESNQTLVPQSYPSKALRGSAENVLGGKSRRPEEDKQSNTNTIPRRSKGGSVGAALAAAAAPLVGMISGQSLLNGGGSHFRRQSDTNNPKATSTAGKYKQLPHETSDLLSNGGSFVSDNIQRMAGKVERPCTLNLSPAPNRPFRAAPPIPSTTSSTSSLSSLSTATDLASASSPQLTASNESINVSVNVTLSPILPARSSVASSGQQQQQHVAKPPIPPRHTSELTVQPEVLPFVPAAPARSFTSVNFTLRQPGTGEGGDGASVASPIDITTAGSSMTYSSSSYNAKQGYQSQLQITVGNGGGSISAIRTKAPQMATNTTTPLAESGFLRGTRNLTTRLDADSEEVLINRQLQSKWKLSTELDKYRKRLEAMQRDVKVLQMPLPPRAGSDALQEEIKRLQTVCDRMAAAVEEAGNFALGETNEAFYQRLDSQSSGSASGTPLAQQRSPSALTTSGTTIGGGGSLVSNSSGSERAQEGEEEEEEGWTCSQCTFQNHPELNMCEQCGMVKRPPPTTPQQQMARTVAPAPPPPGQQQHLQTPGMVQITSSQFIPAHGPTANPAAAHLATNPYMLQAYPGPPRMIYGSPMHQYPPAFLYPVHVTPTSTGTPPVSAGATAGTSGNANVVLGHMLTPPAGTTRREKGKKGGKIHSKFSQSISNLFSSSSSSSSSTTTSNSNPHVNSQE